MLSSFNPKIVEPLVDPADAVSWVFDGNRETLARIPLLWYFLDDPLMLWVKVSRFSRFNEHV
jgi:hypothetical protein